LPQQQYKFAGVEGSVDVVQDSPAGFAFGVCFGQILELYDG
jgi:hypothetical protein